jgi:hypothetical protein
MTPPPAAQKWGGLFFLKDFSKEISKDFSGRKKFKPYSGEPFLSAISAKLVSPLVLDPRPQRCSGFSPPKAPLLRMAAAATVTVYDSLLVWAGTERLLRELRAAGYEAEKKQLPLQEGTTCVGVVMRTYRAIMKGEDPCLVPVLSERGQEWAELREELGSQGEACPENTALGRWAKEKRIPYVEGPLGVLALLEDRLGSESLANNWGWTLPSTRNWEGHAIVFVPGEDLGHCVVIQVQVQSLSLSLLVLGWFLLPSRPKKRSFSYIFFSLCKNNVVFFPARPKSQTVFSGPKCPHTHTLESLRENRAPPGGGKSFKRKTLKRFFFL